MSTVINVREFPERVRVWIFFTILSITCSEIERCECNNIDLVDGSF